MNETKQSTPTTSSKARYISWRWRITTPLLIMIVLVSMIGAYGLVAVLGHNLVTTEENTLLLTSESITNRNVMVFEQLRSEARRVAFTVGVPEAVLSGDVASLQGTLETLARVANLDAIIIANAQGIEQIGLLRVASSDENLYSLATGTDLNNEAFLAVLQSGNAPTTSTVILRSMQGLMITVAQPIIRDGEVVGMVLVGQFLQALIEDLRTGTSAQLSLYDGNGTLLQTSFDLRRVPVNDLTLAPELLAQTLMEEGRVLAPLPIGDLIYRQISTPFDFGGQILGIMTVAQPNNAPFATFAGQQVASIFGAIFAGGVVFVVLGGLSLMMGQVESVAETVTALTRGERARTGMRPSNEITQLGHAVDQYASVVTEHEDKLRTLLRRQRRERNYLLSVLEALPDGVLVQDEEGHLIVMNAIARDLLGRQSSETDTTFHQFDALLQQTLGKAIAPGLYALGDPLALEQDGRMLSAQAAAVLSPTQKRLGTVILLRDITDMVRQSQARDNLLEQMDMSVQAPLSHFAQKNIANGDTIVDEFARHVAHHAATLQKMIVDMRDLTHYSRVTARPRQRMIAIETLIWAVANDWRQIAQAANLTLQVDIRKTGLFILGDESRLRYAIGNIVDNALKYTPAGGIISVEVKDAVNSTVHLRVRDSGVGISEVDYAHIFTPFYRGTPITSDGQVIRVPGMGQGLAQAKQIITAHGGIMRVKTRLHVGTAVYLALPLTSESSYSLPIFNNDIIEGDTVIIPEDVDIETYWRKS